MSVITSNLAGIAKQGERLISAVISSAKPSTWKAAAETAEAARASAATPTIAARAASGIGSTIGTVLAAPFKGAFAVGSWLVAAPISVLVLKPIKAVIGGVASFYEKSPRAAAVLTGGAAVVGVGSWMSRSKAAYMQNEFEAQAMAAQAQAAAPQGPYMNSVSPAEMEAMNARMMADGKVGASHAAAVNAAREKVQAPEAGVGA